MNSNQLPSVFRIIFEQFYINIHTSLQAQKFLLVLLLSLMLCFCSNMTSLAQVVPGTPMTLQNSPQRDTSSKTNSSDWVDEFAKIYYQKFNSLVKYHPDTTLHVFHRRPFSQPWNLNTGNSGSPIVNMFFTPEYRNGPTLGYHAFDPYRFQLDSLNYYNTTRPYSAFTYQLGSKAEQQVAIMHTQNIKPYWNFAVQYRKINSPGFYKIQRVVNDNAAFTTNYTSPKQHYVLKAAIVYNKEQNDENGGILADSFLALDNYNNRKVIPVSFQNDIFSTRRSSVTNFLRDVGLLLQHSYTVGKSDTTYNEDSTQFYYNLIPRFRITHRLQIASEKYQYKDFAPDSLKYTGFFEQGFASEDSVLMEQEWLYADNSLLLNGFIGKEGKQLEVNAGIGIRADRFATNYAIGETTNSFVSNYLTGSFKKEALDPRQWNYEGFARFYFTGQTAGNFIVSASIGKEISKSLGGVNIGFQQELNNAPYNYTVYRNQFYSISKDYSKESITQVFATWNNTPLKLNAGIRNYLVANYIYINEQQQFSQSSDAFNLTQIWLGKSFRFGMIVLDNELAYQQKTGNAPVNVPALMGRHRLAIETRVFKKALKLAGGFDVRYHTPYKSAGYSPFLNRFYYQDAVTITNYPEVAVFFNFKVKNFRAYIMADQLQQFVVENNMTAPNYPAQNFMIRFGFNWVMIN